LIGKHTNNILIKQNSAITVHSGVASILRSLGLGNVHTGTYPHRDDPEEKDMVRSEAK
jgi:ribosomal protein L30/L7E